MHSASIPKSSKLLTLLSRLLLRSPSIGETPAREPSLAELPEVPVLERAERADLLALAQSHHVVVRSLHPFRRVMAAARKYDWEEWAAAELESERARIDNALTFLESICTALEANGCDMTVIKSLDHWPDLGSDLDLYTNGNAPDVIRTMTNCFAARLAPRSWGDRLANKWNFIVPGLHELVEIHVGRLGQTGEQVAFGHTLSAGAALSRVGNHALRVPAPEDRLIVATLQRMYRHFYLRLCDIVNTAQLLETKTVNYVTLRNLAEEAGVWQGVATYLVVVSDYVQGYRDTGLDLPVFVRSAARFGGDQVIFRKGFLRIPIVPHSLALYARELTNFLGNGNLRGVIRLSLLPGLATIAALELKATGSDKGVW